MTSILVGDKRRHRLRSTKRPRDDRQRREGCGHGQECLGPPGGWTAPGASRGRRPCDTLMSASRPWESHSLCEAPGVWDSVITAPGHSSRVAQVGPVLSTGVRDAPAGVWAEPVGLLYPVGSTRRLVCAAWDCSFRVCPLCSLPPSAGSLPKLGSRVGLVSPWGLSPWGGAGGLGFSQVEMGAPLSQ